MSKESQSTKIKKKYYLLRLISTLMKVIGILLFVISVIGIIATSSSVSFSFSFGKTDDIEAILPLVLLILCIMGVIASILIYTFSDIIKILINIEENTRKNLE